MEKKYNMSDMKLGKFYTIGGIITVVIVAYYATGLYKNMLSIKKLKKGG